MILPCGVSSAPNRPSPGCSSVDIGRDEAVEEVARVLAADLDHAPVGKKRCFHSLKRPLLTVFLKFLGKRKWRISHAKLRR